ncbi:MAG: hypothetical protein JRJ46_11125 [Deltaproteobacteria bacterium]|nr:hypothetical protein [Deltaproteobacteria bacterium]
MNLLTHIKRKRKQQRKKQLIKGDTFNQISGIVRTYGLKKNFLNVLENTADYLSKVNLNANRVRVKAPMESPLFSLATQDEYALTLSIIRKIDNSYLLFAHSPEELLWCGPLYQLNSSLNPDKLARYHFETLFLHERAKADNQEPDGMQKANLT